MPWVAAADDGGAEGDPLGAVGGVGCGGRRGRGDTLQGGGIVAQLSGGLSPGGGEGYRPSKEACTNHRGEGLSL